MTGGSRARMRRGARRLRGAWRASQGRLRGAALRMLARIHEPRRVAHPFFQALHELLEREGDLSLEHLFEESGEQTYGLLILLLALASFIPGISIAGGAAIVAVGLQMAAGVPRPWLPARVRALKLHQGRVKEALARFEGWLAKLGGGPAVRRPLNRRAVGMVVAWSGFILALPVPVVILGGNALPAAALCLLGAALLEERPGWAWVGVAGSLLTTVYLGFSFDLIFRAMRHLIGRG